MAETTIKIPRLASSQKVPQANQLSHTKIDDLSNVQQAQDDTNDRKQVEDDKHPSPKDHEEGVDEEDEQQEKPVIKEVKEQNKLKRRTRHGRSASHTPSTSPSRAPEGPAREEDVLKGRGSHTPIPRNKSDIVLRRNRSGGSLLMGNSKAASKPGPKTRTKGGISGTRRSVLMDQSSKKGSSKGVMEQDQSEWGSEGLQQDDEGEWIEASNSPSPEVSRAHSRRGSARPQPNHQQDEDRAEQLDRTFLRGQKGDGQDSPGKETRLPPSTHFVPTIPPSRIPGDSFEAQLSHSRPPSLLSPTGLHKSPKPDISAKMGANQSREEAKARQGFGPNPQRKDRGPSLNLLDGLKQGSNLKAGPSAALSGTTIVNDVSSGQHYLQQPLEDDGEGMTSSFLRFPKDEDDYAHSCKSC